MPDSPEPAERDRFWLDREAEIQLSGQAEKEYAAAQELSLPNGIVLEWSGAELPSPVVELLERLTQPR